MEARERERERERERRERERDLYLQHLVFFFPFTGFKFTPPGLGALALAVFSLFLMSSFAIVRKAVSTFVEVLALVSIKGMLSLSAKDCGEGEREGERERERER